MSDRKIEVPAVYLSDRYNFVVDASGKIVPQENIRKRYHYWVQYDGRELTKDEKEYLFRTEGNPDISSEDRKLYAEAHRLYRKEDINRRTWSRSAYRSRYSMLKSIPRSCSDAKWTAAPIDYLGQYFAYDKKSGTFRADIPDTCLDYINIHMGLFIAKSKILDIMQIKTAEKAYASGALTTILFTILHDHLDASIKNITPEQLVNAFNRYHGKVKYSGNIRRLLC